MFSFNLSAAMAFAVLAAYAVPADADDVNWAAGAIDLERNNSASILTRIRAGDAYAHGITGTGVTIALFDSGIALSLVPGASHAAIAQRVGDVKLRFGMQTSGLNPILASQQSYLSSHTTQPTATSGLVEVSKSFGAAALSVSLSQTRESNAYLGSYASGPLTLGPGASTSALQVAGAVMLAPRLALAGQAAYGVTPGGSSSDRLVTEVSTTRTNAFSLALVAADQMKRGDRLSVSLSQPMRTYAGRISMDVLSRTRGSGASRERLVFSMVPLGREMRVQLSYQTPAGPGAYFGASLIARRDRNNMDDVSVERLLVLRYVKQF
jgi:hypothetical protein